MVFPSLKARQFLKVLKRKPLSYRVVAQVGSHRKLESENGYPPIDFVFHDRVEIPPGLIRRILCQHVGLTQDEAKDLI